MSTDKHSLYAPYFDGIQATDPYVDSRIKVLAYGIQYTGKTTQSLDVYLEYLASRARRGLPVKKLLRVTGEPSGETAVQPLVEAGLATNISIAQVTRPKLGYTCEGFLRALAARRLVVPCPVSARYPHGIKTVPLDFNDYGMLLFEGIDSTASLLADHMHAAGINVVDPESKDTPPPKWSSSVPAGDDQDAESHEAGGMNKNTYNIAQNTIVLLTSVLNELPFDVVIMTSHERTSEEKSTVGGKAAESLGRLNGPAVVGPAGVKKLLTQVDLLYHTETAPDGSRWVFFDSHPDLTAPTISWTACSRLDPMELNTLQQLVAYEAQQHQRIARKGGLMVVPGLPNDPNTRGIAWLLRASRFLRNASMANRTAYLESLKQQVLQASASVTGPVPNPQ